MAMFPDRDGDYMLTEPGSYVVGANKDVVRIIMHQTWAYQSITDQAPINYRVWTSGTREGRKKHPQFGVSAHFTVEADGRIFQHVDTKDGAKGTSAYAYNAVHIEFASRDEPLTDDQLHYGAGLMAWIASEHPNLRLVVVGESNKHPGDKKQAGITCHSFVELVGKAAHPKLTCPGPKIVDQMNTIAVLASVRAALV
ncbi:peptidoglycan recognition protein family protein [Alsobacter metallidurans]|nr:N-acetylmuramoyl-L-alanine amidase [Alsobacter metallidurans]